MPQKGDTLSNGKRCYRIARISRGKEFIGEPLYWLRGALRVDFGPYTYERLKQNGYKSNQAKENGTMKKGQRKPWKLEIKIGGNSLCPEKDMIIARAQRARYYTTLARLEKAILAAPILGSITSGLFFTALYREDGMLNPAIDYDRYGKRIKVYEEYKGVWDRTPKQNGYKV